MNVLRLVKEPEDRIALSAIHDLLSPNNLNEFNSLDTKSELEQMSFWDIVDENLHSNNPLNDLATKLVQIHYLMHHFGEPPSPPPPQIPMTPN